ncbi:MAG TPA: GNAT family N-acetyltransferase [Herpetosiphonaceae bacterium]
MQKLRSESMRQLSPADGEQAAEVLGRAFYRDPLWLYLLPDDTQRAVAVRQSFRSFAPWFIRKQQAYGVGEPLAGVAIWGRPNEASAGIAGLINVHLLTLLASPLILRFRRVIPIFAQFDVMQRRYAPEPHYYLSTIGVVSEAQGQGLASLLIKPFLAQADAQASSTYTETMTPSNVPLYEHYGFRCMEQFDIPETDLSIWSLYRPAREAAGIDEGF